MFVSRGRGGWEGEEEAIPWGGPHRRCCWRPSPRYAPQPEGNSCPPLPKRNIARGV